MSPEIYSRKTNNLESSLATDDLIINLPFKETTQWKSLDKKYFDSLKDANENWI